MSVETYEKNLWKRLAYAARYGKQSLGDLFQLDSRAFSLFCSALNEIVSEENNVKGGNK